MLRRISLIVGGCLVLAVSVAVASGPKAVLKPMEGLTAKDEVRVQVLLSDLTEARGYGFALEYDPTKYQFLSAEQGVDNVFGSQSPLFLTSTKESGKVLIANASVTSTAGVTGGGPAAVVAFRRIDNALGEFRLSDLTVLDASGSVNSIKNIESLDMKPTEFGMEQNYPNPFNPSTQINYRIPVDTNVRVAVFNILGQRIRTLVEAYTPAGEYAVNWDGKDQAGRQVASGMYLYRMDAGSFKAIKRMTLLK